MELWSWAWAGEVRCARDISRGGGAGLRYFAVGEDVRPCGRSRLVVLRGRLSMRVESSCVWGFDLELCPGLLTELKGNTG